VRVSTYLFLYLQFLVIRNQGVVHGGHVGHQKGAREPRNQEQQGGDPIQFGVMEFDFVFNSKCRTILTSN
jgi:hypothetical protein